MEFTTKWLVKVVCQEHPNHHRYPTILELPEGEDPPGVGEGLGEGHRCLVVVSGQACGAPVRVFNKPIKQVP